MFSSADIVRQLGPVDILRRVSQADIFRFYLQLCPVILKNKPFSSPFRVDKNPSCNFYLTKGVLGIKDHSTGDFISCFKAVSIKENLLNEPNMNKVLTKIWNDLPEIEKIKQKDEYSFNPYKPHKNQPKKKRSEIKIEARDWRDYDLEWWNKFGITQNILDTYKVYPVNRAFINSKVVYVNSKNDPCYGYYFKSTDTLKLYRPLHTKYKWSTNAGPEVIQGIERALDTEDLIITKSLKDVMTLKAADFNAVAVQSETTPFSEPLLDLIKRVRENNNKVFILYDNDAPGRAGAKVQSEKYDIPMIEIPESTGCKDSSDFVVKFGIHELYDCLIRVIEHDS
jgi:hypothetical protein